jgi:hypothetical protein
VAHQEETIAQLEKMLRERSSQLGEAKEKVRGSQGVLGERKGGKGEGLGEQAGFEGSWRGG